MKEPNTIHFTKMSGTGNDFIVFDNRAQIYMGGESEFFKRICRRRVSVGADGILLVEESRLADIRMRYFNRDGGESTMCGNGARCVGFFAWEKKIVNKEVFRLEASDGVHTVEIVGHSVTLGMTRPRNFRFDLGILKEVEFVEGGFVNTGVPHYVVFVDDVDDIDVERVGAFYRSHEAFAEGTNVNFVQRMGRNRIRVRTYERGVEEETLSCGTGCVASAVIAAKRVGYGSPIAVTTRGGKLTVGFDMDFEEVALTGRVEIVYEGVLSFPKQTVGRGVTG
jgi:diaminopimelate epimerase